jgi:hypothetical protein
MIRIAREFFEHNRVLLPKGVRFDQTDLCLYLKLLYGEAPAYGDRGIIKVIDTPEGELLTEHIYHDHAVGRGDRFITLPSLPLRGTRITNCALGHSLSTRGYAPIEVSTREQSAVLARFREIPYRLTPESQGLDEPYGTFKFNPNIWGSGAPPEGDPSTESAVYWGIRKLLWDQLAHSEVLQSMDAYDLNLLEWRRGRKMTAHNGVDYKSFINLISYNTEHCTVTRALNVGTHDWYDTTFQSIFSGDFSPLMNIHVGKQELDSFQVTTGRAILVSVFNPRFYHEVGQMTGEGSLYVCTSNMSFRSITDRYQLAW